MQRETRGQLGSGPGPRVKGFAWAVAVGLVLGAILATLAVGLRPGPTGIADLDLVFLDENGGPEPGRPYVLDLELDQAGYPIVVHVDADGLPSLLFPFAQPVRLGAGQRVRLPDPTGAASWWAPSGEDAGSLLVAVHSGPTTSTDRLLELAERAAARADDARAARDDVREVLARQWGRPVLRELGDGAGGPRR